jgi:predicted PurR-regulated permease PerM
VKTTDGPPVENGRIFQRLLLILCAVSLFALLPFVSGLVGALVLFVGLHPVQRLLRQKMPARGAALLLVLLALFVILIPGAWLLVTLAKEARDALAMWSTGATMAWLKQRPIGAFDIAALADRVNATVGEWLSGHAIAFFGDATMTFLNLIIALFGLYYLLVGGEALWPRVKRLLPLPSHISDELSLRFEQVTMALLLGTMLTAVVQGTIIGVALALVGLRGAMLWGAVTACASLLPLFGSALVWLPATAILILDHRPGAAVFLGIMGAGLASNIDNVIRLILFRRISGIHPMITLLGGFAGMHVFGLMGALIGPLMLSYLVELLQVHERFTLSSDHFDHHALLLAQSGD